MNGYVKVFCRALNVFEASLIDCIRPWPTSPIQSFYNYVMSWKLMNHIIKDDAAAGPRSQRYPLLTILFPYEGFASHTDPIALVCLAKVLHF